MVQTVISTKDNIVLVQGDAGTGKTSSLKVIKEIIEKEKPDMSIIGVGFTGKASHELNMQAGIPSKTVSSFLNDAHMPTDKPRLIICDESSMLGSLQTKDLISKIKAENSRLILLGDGKQLQALSAGKPFLDLQQRSNSFVVMTQTLRQKTEHLRATVNYIKEFQTGKNQNGIDAAFSFLEANKKIKEIRSKKAVYMEISKAYISSKDRNQTIIITPSNKARTELNQEIRERLKETGKLGPEEIYTQVYSPVTLPGIRAHFAENYDVGQAAFVEMKNHKTGEKQFFHGIIFDKDHQTNSLKFLIDNSKIQLVNLRDPKKSTAITLYEPQTRHFSPGDKIVFTKNDKMLGVQNGTSGTIKSIAENGALNIQFPARKDLLGVDVNSNKFIDWSYALSVHKSQGASYKDVIYYANTKHSMLNKTESLYVAVSRATHNFQLYTDDKNRLKEQFKSGQEKTSTLTINQSQNLLKSKEINHDQEKGMER